MNQEDWFGQAQWQFGYERGWDKAMEVKREWVGLTDNDIWEVFKEHDPMQYIEFSRAIEAKLKEKNSDVK
jgi:hypothetical protein